MLEKMVGVGQRVELFVESPVTPRGNIEDTPGGHKIVGCA
jgi:hypothetical protein